MAIINKIGESGLLTNPLLTQFSTKPGNISTWGTGQTQPEPEAEPEEYFVDGGTVTATRTYWAEMVAIAGGVGYMLDEKRRPLYGFMVMAGIGARLVGFMGRKKIGAVEFKGKAVRYYLKAEKQSFSKMKIQGVKDAYLYCKSLYDTDILIYESFFALFLNNANNVVGHAKIGQGGVTSTVADINIICKYAIDVLARSVIIVHNHPSGNLTPSEADKLLVKNLGGALKAFNIMLIDSLIITDDDYYSMANNGDMIF